MTCLGGRSSVHACHSKSLTRSDNLCQLYFGFPPYCRRLGIQVYDIGVTPAR